VDDAIVMLENISRHMEMGKSAMRATLDGSRRIAFTILSMTLSLAAVFIPVLFMSGILGRLLHEFAVTDHGGRCWCPGFVSLTLTPMLCAAWLRPEHERSHGRFYALTEAAFDAWKRSYDVTLSWVLRHQRLTLIVFFAIFAGTACSSSHAQGLPAERGFRAALRLHRGRGGHFLRGHVEGAAAGGRDRARRIPRWSR
jgi:HAE1 family hydrophobic/amphiphilic exporter-1